MILGGMSGFEPSGSRRRGLAFLSSTGTSRRAEGGNRPRVELPRQTARTDPSAVSYHVAWLLADSGSGGPRAGAASNVLPL